ncbi:diguanylate cyclase domain-containing protein [Roseateles sp. DB2]|uniref:diguanylate cyclase domain-containing protein n=1 Tax=Roseateles sp. DB2 TaxID=3453717 RepID=UPI003EEA9972
MRLRRRLLRWRARWRNGPRLTQGLPWAILLLGLMLSLGLWSHERREAEHVQQREIEAVLHAASQRLDHRLDALQQILSAVHALAQTQEPATGLPLDESRLRRFLDALPLGADHAGLEGLALVRWMPSRTADDNATPRALLGPLLPGPGLLGQSPDLWREPLLQPTLQRARDSGQPALSPSLDLRSWRLGRSQGVVLVQPLFRTALDGSHRLESWVLAPVALGALMDPLQAQMPHALSLRLFEGEVLQDRSLLYQPSQALAQGLLQREERLQRGGQAWTLQLVVHEGYAPLAGQTEPLTLGLLGGLGSLLLALLAWALAGSRERAQALAQRMTRALRESEQRWAFALEGAGDGVWDWDMRADTLVTTARWKALMGWPLSAPEPRFVQMLPLVHPDDHAGLRQRLRECIKGGRGSFEVEYRVRAEGGGWRWRLARGRIVERDGVDQPLRMIGTLSDIDARRQSEAQIHFLARHDPLTELANRAHFSERLQQALAHARRYRESLGLILVDLDRFKPVNDIHGHAVGDELLQAMARRLKAAVRETDVVGRIGGDEFLVLLCGPVSRESARHVAEKIYNLVAEPLQLGELSLELTCSVGLAMYPEDGEDERSLKKAADDAMYASKRAGRLLLGAAGG